MTQPGDDPATTEPGTPAWRVRPARAEDAVAIHRLVCALAAYEREPDAVEGSPEDFGRVLFGEQPQAFCHVAEVDDPEHGPVVAGIALWFVSFSTWKTRHGLWLEDLFVLPEYRRFGLGRALLAALAQVCVDRGYPRFEWWVLDWNTPAHAFYRSLGAVPQDEWTVWRMDADAIARTAAG